MDNISTSDVEMQFGVCPAGFGLALVEYFLTVFSSLCFEMVMYMLEVCDLIFDFDFTGDDSEEIAWLSEETLNFGLLNIVETVIDYGDFWS